MRFMMFVIVTAMVVLGAVVTVAQAADQKITLMLGGKHCDSYLNDVETALKKVSGVQSVDVKSMPGHAVVTMDTAKSKPEQAAEAVNGVKGDGWNCTGKVMK
jgi:copper chaperone CopZ